MDENNDEITDSTDGHLAGVRAGAMRLQQIQRDINMNLVDARLHAGSTNVLDQARAVQIGQLLIQLDVQITLTISAFCLMTRQPRLQPLELLTS